MGDIISLSDMGKLLFVLSAIAISSTPAIAETQSRRWIRVMSDPLTGNNHFFDVNSLVNTTNEIGNYIKSFDSKIVFSRPVETGVSSAIVNVEVNCQNRTMRSLRFEQYDTTDSLIAVDNLSNEWYAIPLNNTPNATVMNGFYTLACN